MESQFDEIQVNEKELENFYGGDSGCTCMVRLHDCICDSKIGFADEDEQENIVF